LTHALSGARPSSRGAPAPRAAKRIVAATRKPRPRRPRRCNGSGYPDQLAGIEIPAGARIVAVCDAFDAMISNRPYATPRTIDDALVELRRCAGTQFDPGIVSLFEQVVADRAKPPTADTAA
jgi:hypothetical protein